MFDNVNMNVGQAFDNFKTYLGNLKYEEMAKKEFAVPAAVVLTTSALGLVFIFKTGNSLLNNAAQVVGYAVFTGLAFSAAYYTVNNPEHVTHMFNRIFYTNETV